MDNQETAKSIYNRLKQDRDSYTKRAEECAKVTIPSLFPSDSSTGSDNFETPYQSMGSRGVNNLSHKLLLALFPPNATFFRLSPSEEVQAELAENPEALKDIETALASQERVILKYIETNQIRVTIGEATKQLVVAGNNLLYLPPDGGIKSYRLNNYVIQRDALGNVLTIITLDKIAYAALPKELKGLVDTNGDIKPDKEVEVYTHVQLEDDFYSSYQEVDGKRVPRSEGKYPKDSSPWFPLRMVKVDGENYGRSYVEEYIGDLKSCESIQKALTQITAIVSHILILVNPTGITSASKLQKAKAGEFVPGRLEDIQALLIGKLQDLQVAESNLNRLESRLGYAFMLNSSVQRNGERVTAEEIRYVAGELEDNLGGIYSILTQELQLPLVRRLLSQLQSLNKLPQLPDGTVEPAITTGMEALGRGHDLMKLQTFLEFATKLPETVNRLKVDGLLTMLGNSIGLDLSTIIKSDEEVQQEMMQQQMMEMAQKTAPQYAAAELGQ
jgi:hypothetical protein